VHQLLRRATSGDTVLNGFITMVKRQQLLQEVSFKMSGKPQFIYAPTAGVSYRLFARATVNSKGSFYRRQELQEDFRTTFSASQLAACANIDSPA
jgi:hypothetical protein